MRAPPRASSSAPASPTPDVPPVTTIVFMCPTLRLRVVNAAGGGSDAWDAAGATLRDTRADEAQTVLSRPREPGNHASLSTSSIPKGGSSGNVDGLRPVSATACLRASA